MQNLDLLGLERPTARCTCRVGGAQYCIDECGGISRAESGHVTSPFFPQQYATDLDCTWNIDIPDAVVGIISRYASVRWMDSRSFKMFFLVIYFHFESVLERGFGFFDVLA